MTKICVAALAALLALPLAGCSKTLKTDSVESKIRELAQGQGLKVKDVSCPNDVKAKAGRTFQCKVTYQDGRTQNVDIRQRDGNGNVTLTFVPVG